MSEKGKARTGAAASERAAECEIKADYNTKSDKSQCWIVDFLLFGRENALTGRDLARVSGRPQRTISKAVERARRHGAPICASTDETPGYYLELDSQEVMSFINASLLHRADEIRLTAAGMKRGLVEGWRG